MWRTRKYADKLIEQVVKGSTVSFPDVMVQETVQERFEDLVERSKETQGNDRRLSEIYGETRREHSRPLRRRIEEINQRLSLVFHEIMERENIKVEDEDVEAEIAVDG